MDYILFITADVTVTPNTNEIRDHKYVDKAELQSMFEQPGMDYCVLVLRTIVCITKSLFFLGNLFTPWFKLIARDFLFDWWDKLLERKNEKGLVWAHSLAGVVDGSRVIKMV